MATEPEAKVVTDKPDVEVPAVDEVVLKEATGQGWVPKEKFKGNEDDWVDASTFVKRGREILPILRKNNENLVRELNQTKASLQEFKLAADEFKRFQKDAYERKARELEQEVVELRAAKAQAITDGDGKRVDVLDEAIDAAKQEAKAAKADSERVVATCTLAPVTGVDPKLQTWLDKNDWFGKDKRLTAMTNSLGEALRAENPALIGDAFLEKLDEALAETFPAKFGKETRTPGFQVEAGGRTRPSGGGGKRGYESLPAEAKAACDRFVKQKLMTKEAYLADYDWNE